MIQEVNVKPSGFDQALHKINEQIQTLNRHLQCVNRTGMAKHILKEIDKQRAKRSLILSKIITQPPKAGGIILDKEVQNAVR